MSDYPEPPSHHLADSHGHGAPLGDRPGLDMSHIPETSAEPDDAKRPRACEPCRQLKVRCDPDPIHPHGSCKRCAKAHRTCITTAPTRKRQKKTDSRVTELERKIDALTATLQASHSKPFMGPSPQTQPSLHDSSSSVAGTKRTHDGFLASQYARSDSPSAQQLPRPSDSVHWRGPYAGDIVPPKENANAFADVIDKGIVDIDSANAAFQRYVTRMAPEMPFVIIPPGTTMGDVRRDKPALFLSIIAAAIGPYKKDVQVTLLNDAYQTIADRVVVKGEKCLELVQALMVCSIWYLPPDKLEELKFYQLVHLAVILCMDLGLNRPVSNEPKPFMKLREQLIKKPPGDMKGPEARRTWLGCYFMSVQVSTALRRTQLLRWSSYMDECVETLKTHPDALPTDRQAIWWVKLAFIMEDASTQLSDDTEKLSSFIDSKVRYTIRGFSNQLSQWRRDIPDDIYSDVLAHTYHVLNLFVHETAMGIDCKNNGIIKSSSGDQLPASAIAPLIDALTTCINSIHYAFDIILSVDSDRLTCLPTVALARTSYPLVSLIKIHCLLTAPDSRIGQVIDIESLKLEYYLDHITNHYRKAASLGGGRAVAKFGNIITMLRNWFVKQKDNGPALREIFATETNSEPEVKQPMRGSTTPLELLSIVASSGQTKQDTADPFSERRSQIVYTPSTLTPGLPPTQSPNPTSRLDPLNHLPKPEQPWTTPTSFSPSIHNQNPSISSMTPVSTTESDQTRPFYSQYPQPYTTPNHNQQTPTFAEIPMGASASTGPGAGPGGTMPMAPMMGMPGNEMDMDPNFNPDNFFALETMMDEGLFTFPLSFENLGFNGLQF
ncbi:hypothetical protein N7509_008018 [Penicillium cosmopolitanum]|uniref:Zn(2)-C6 fungal-type domain-containing protein n=1 Tax=Penicillium cosmopolitanum TaxID=1131564 RepID=A0A9X0B910_9EURO|nr:uncharacterized protein N7509_008018 [Penicillium cosmopolitanum]KAJ5392528.1 hypothetical protein N7509_008018 [Penicillium cosmopolitanum]